MDAHAGAEHDFARDVGRFRHLHHLAENKLFNDFRRDFAAGQQFADHHFTEIDRRNAVVRRCLTGERRAQSTDNGNAIPLPGDQR